MLPITKSLKINGKSIKFELDTGSGVSIISAVMAETLFDCSVKYQVIDQKLHTFAGHSLQVLGKVTVTAQYGRKCRELPLYIVNGSGPNLLWRYWLKLLDIHIPRINAIHETLLSLEHVLQKHAAVFQPGLGELKGIKVHLSFCQHFTNHAQYLMHCEKKLTTKSIILSRWVYSSLFCM